MNETKIHRYSNEMKIPLEKCLTINFLGTAQHTVSDDRRRGGSSGSSGGQGFGGQGGGGSGRSRDDPRRHTLGGDMLGYAHHQGGLPLQRSMDLEVMGGCDVAV